VAEDYPRLKKIWADSAFGKNGVPEWAQAELGVDLEIVQRAEGALGWHPANPHPLRSAFQQVQIGQGLHLLRIPDGRILVPCGRGARHSFRSPSLPGATSLPHPARAALPGE
jgi:hypothetical protein